MQQQKLKLRKLGLAASGKVFQSEVIVFVVDVLSIANQY